MAKYKENQAIWWTTFSALAYNFLYFKKPTNIGLLSELKNNQIDKNYKFTYIFYQLDCFSKNIFTKYRNLKYFKKYS